eukprot:4879285-Amphidinium_carterae.1
MIACERLQGQGTVVTDCKGAAVVAKKLQQGLRRPRGRHSRIEHRIQASIGVISVQWMPSHQTAQQAEVANIPARYVAGNAEADLLAGRAVQAVPPLPFELGLFRRAAAAARSFWSLFPAACSPPHRVQEDSVSQSRWPTLLRAFSPSAEGTSSSAQGPPTQVQAEAGVERKGDLDTEVSPDYSMVDVPSPPSRGQGDVAREAAESK